MYVTRRIPKPGPEFLKKNGCTLTFWDSDDAIPHEDLVKNIKADKYDALLCMLTDQVDAAVMDAAGELFLLTKVFCSPKHWSENRYRSGISQTILSCDCTISSAFTQKVCRCHVLYKSKEMSVCYHCCIRYVLECAANAGDEKFTQMARRAFMNTLVAGHVC